LKFRLSEEFAVSPSKSTHICMSNKTYHQNYNHIAISTTKNKIDDECEVS